MKAEPIIMIGLLAVIFLSIVVAGFMPPEEESSEISYEQVLGIIAEAKASELSRYFDSHRTMSSMLAIIPGFIDAASNPSDPQALHQAQRIINMTLEQDVRGLVLLDVNGAILAQDPRIMREQILIPQEALESGSIRFERYYDDLRHNDYFAVVAPVFDRSGVRVGSVIYDLDMSDIDKILSGISSPFVDEVYLIDDSGTLLSTSLLQPEQRYALLVQEVRTAQAAACQMHNAQYLARGYYSKTDNPLLYENYRGDDVIGNHAHIFALLGCVIAEKNVPADGSRISGFFTDLW